MDAQPLSGPFIQARGLEYRTRFPLFVVVAAMAVSCGRDPAPDSDPASRAANFISAIQREDCEQAWTYYSEQTQRDIREESARYVQQSPWYAESFAPKQLYCGSTMVNTYPSYVPGTAELVGMQGDTAVVRIQQKIREGYALPGFFATSFRLEPREIQLVQEGGAWKISHPRLPSGASAQAVSEVRESEAGASDDTLAEPGDPP